MQDDLNRAITCPKNLRNVIFAEQKGACGTQEDLNRAITCPKNPRNVILAEKNAPAARRKTTPRYHSQMDTDICVIGHTHIQFEL